MTSPRKWLVACAVALMTTCCAAGSASATTIDPASTAFTLLSTNSVFTISPGGPTFSCSNATISGTTPATGGGTTATVASTTLAWSGCSLFGTNIQVTPNEGCHTAATSAKLDFMGISATSAALAITLPVGCNIDLSIPGVCTWVITGGQTIGNGTAGTGGIAWTNASPKSSTSEMSTTIPVVDNTIAGSLCPVVGTTSATLSGNYTVSSPTNITVTP